MWVLVRMVRTGRRGDVAMEDREEAKRGGLADSGLNHHWLSKSLCQNTIAQQIRLV